MKLLTLFRPRRTAPTPLARTDWSEGWTARDWADLPPYHPAAEDARR
ncbi:hypothetical protein [Arsenicitalea aurantiaca]|nr:hypothetical protein [Arsenicitalea aurantiaca]